MHPLKPIPDLKAPIGKRLRIGTILWLQIADTLSGAGQIDLVPNTAVGLHVFQHVVKIHYVLIVRGVVEFEMPEKIVFVVRTDTAGTGFCVHAPYIQILGIGVLSLPTHFNQWEPGLEHLVPAWE